MLLMQQGKSLLLPLIFHSLVVSSAPGLQLPLHLPDFVTGDFLTKVGLSLLSSSFQGEGQTDDFFRKDYIILALKIKPNPCLKSNSLPKNYVVPSSLSGVDSAGHEPDSHYKKPTDGTVMRNRVVMTSWRFIVFTPSDLSVFSFGPFVRWRQRLVARNTNGLMLLLLGDEVYDPASLGSGFFHVCTAFAPPFGVRFGDVDPGVFVDSLQNRFVLEEVPVSSRSGRWCISPTQRIRFDLPLNPSGTYIPFLDRRCVFGVMHSIVDEHSGN
ncbi:hypothetical protein YC2023_023755 [Brassica napus]